MNAIQLWRPALDTVYCMDALTLLRQMPDASVDCVVTSPPYNIRNSTGNGFKSRNDKSLWSNQPMRNGYHSYTDNLPHEEYIAWQRQILDECMRVLKPTGAIFYNHKWRVQNGILQRLVDEVTEGLPVRQIIIWSRGNGINFNTGYFLPSYEVIYLIAKPGFKLQPGTNVLMDVWHIPPLEKKEHPNAFPESLVERCLHASTVIESVVLDPFAGSGTTLVAARNLGRHYIGCDISAEYVDMARQRLALPYMQNMFERLEATP